MLLVRCSGNSKINVTNYLDFFFLIYFNNTPKSITNIINPTRIKNGWVNVKTSYKMSCTGSYPKRNAKNKMIDIILNILRKKHYPPL
ncbi:hypothetical protein CJ485_24110 [Priestia filamentosa]|nr:hypothetical protein CJ485_24110 [Priestia filamentosa]